jgi:hypothetical protein
MAIQILSCDTRGHTFSVFAAVTPVVETLLSGFCPETASVHNITE